MARLEDAEFFYHEDQTKSISDYMTKVKKWTYDNGIQGLQIRANKELSANELNQMYKQQKNG